MAEQTQQPSGWTPKSTMYAGASTAALGILYAYLKQCQAAGHLTMPDEEMLGLIATVLAPFIHAIGSVVMTKLNQWGAAKTAGAVLLAFLFVPALTGCTFLNSAVSGGTSYLSGSEAQAKANAQAIDDLKLKTQMDALCATNYGAMVRAPLNESTAIVDACGLPNGLNVIKSTTGISLATGTGPTTIASPAPATTGAPE